MIPTLAPAAHALRPGDRVTVLTGQPTEAVLDVLHPGPSGWALVTTRHPDTGEPRQLAVSLQFLARA